MAGSPGTRLIPDMPEGPRAALVVATGRYEDPGLSQLRAPARDAEDLAEVLGDPGIGAFAVTQVIDADERKIRREIDGFLSDRGVGDLVVVYLSCHGVLDRRNRLYFSATDTDKAQLGSTGIASTWLLDQLEECRARRRVLILDCCFSGAFAHGSKGDTDLDLERRLAGHGRGFAVLTASRAGEYSFEGKALPGVGIAGSVFTAGLVEGLRTGAADIGGDGHVSVDEAFDYAYDYVKSRGVAQTPQRWLYGGEGSIVLARSPIGIVAAPIPPRGGRGSSVSVEYAICRLSRSGRLVGLGFAVDREHVVTCAHVVNKAHRGDDSLPPRALDQADFPGSEVTLDVEFTVGRFTADGTDPGRAGDAPANSLTAGLPPEGWLPSDPARFTADDIAVLRLSAPVPAYVPSVSAGRWHAGDVVQMFGPVTGRPDGGHVAAEVLGEVSSGWIQIDVGGQGFRVRPGFSGGPVWRRETGEVVGMLVAVGLGETAVDAYMLDAARIARLLPAWGGTSPQGTTPSRDVRDPHGERLTRLEEAARRNPRFAEAALTRLGAGEDRFIATRVDVRDGDVVSGSSLYAIGIRPGPVTAADVADFRASLERHLPEHSEIRSAYLVVLGGPVDPDLSQRALATGMVVQTFREFQAGVDPRQRPAADMLHSQIRIGAVYDAVRAIARRKGDRSAGSSAATTAVKLLRTSAVLFPLVLGISIFSVTGKFHNLFGIDFYDNGALRLRLIAALLPSSLIGLVLAGISAVVHMRQIRTRRLASDAVATVGDGGDAPLRR